MEIVARKIGNSVGAIFPKEISPKVGESFTIVKVDDAYVMKPKREDIFKHEEDWVGFRDSVSEEDKEWDSMSHEGKEV